MRTWVVALAVLAYSGLYEPPALARHLESQKLASRDQKFNFVVNGMRNERHALKSGICNVRGDTSTVNTEHLDNSIAGPVIMMFAFDEQGNERLDRAEPGWINESLIPGKGAQAKTHQGIVSAKSCRSGGKSAFWIVGQRDINVMAPNFRLQNDLLRPFDPRSLGYGGVHELQRGTTFEETLKQHLARRPPVISDSESDLWEVTWQFDNSSLTSQWRIWVDTSRGFTPVRGELRGRSASNAEWRISQSTETKWEQVSNVWVPVRYSLVSTPTDTFRQAITYDLTWTNVNKPIDLAIFDYKSFGAQDSVGIVDSSLGQPVVIKMANVPEASTNWWAKSTWIGLGLFGVLVTSVVWFWRRQWSQRS